MEPACASVEDLELLRVHTDAYSRDAKAAFLRLVELWSDLGLSPQEQTQHLSSVTAEAAAVWCGAVAAAEAAQQQLRQSIQQSLAEVAAIKAALGGDDVVGADANEPQRSGHRTLCAWQQDVAAKAAYWQQVKRQREAEHDELLARIRQLRSACGLAALAPASPPDISAANLRFMELERERLAAERERREDVMRQLLAQLAALCSEIGEDVRAAATEVHVSLAAHSWDAEADKVLRDVLRRAGTASSMDLSDATISRLGAKLASMRALKAERSSHGAEVLSVLRSLWDAVDAPAAERGAFEKMMAGPLGLHARSLEKCLAEVRRLEELRAQQLVDLVNTKAAELQALCADSHVQAPTALDAELAAINSTDRNPGAAAELLAKLMQCRAEVAVLAAKRADLVGSITALQDAIAEDTWLAAYEADEQRYKGRDANKRLQRAIRASKLRERLPAMVAELRSALAEWREAEGAPFMYDGRDFQFEVLEPLAAEVEAAAAAREAKGRAASSRRQSLMGTSSAGGAVQPTSRPTTPRSSVAGAASPALRRVGGPATPIPLRSVSGRALNERHSVCVIRTGSREVLAGTAALSRSGELSLGSSHAAATAGQAAARSRPSSSSMCTPPRKPQQVGLSRSRAAPASTTPPCDAAVKGGASTNSKLEAILRRSSVQHPVAQLLIDERAAADQDIGGGA